MTEYRNRPRDEATEKIECYIIQNRLQPHVKIPSERNLCDMWKVNRTTLRSAIKRLIVEGKLYNRKGSGTFVAQPKIERNLQDMTSLDELINKSGSTLLTKVLSMRTMESTKQISQKLHIPLGHKVYELVRLRIIDGEPALLETSFLDSERFHGIDPEYLASGALYRLLVCEYGVQIAGGMEKISITYVTQREAEILGLEEETAVFFVNGVTWDESEQPVECFKSLVRADKMKFASTLIR